VSNENPGSACGFQSGNTCAIHAVMNAYSVGNEAARLEAQSQHQRLDDAIDYLDDTIKVNGMTIYDLQKLCRDEEALTELQCVIGQVPCKDLWIKFGHVELKKAKWQEDREEDLIEHIKEMEQKSYHIILSLHIEGSELTHFVALAQAEDDNIQDDGFLVIDSNDDSGNSRKVYFNEVHEAFLCGEISECGQTEDAGSDDCKCE